MYDKGILLVSLCFVLATAVMAEIKNGYARDLPAARECLRGLNRRLLESTEMQDSERRRIKAAIKMHLQVIAHYQLTEALLHQMRIISPDMYAEMDQLRDKRSRVTDIFVRFIPEEQASVLLSGASFFHASDRDEDASQSQFGPFTVSIDVWICETALHLLAHEFGHVKYIVPNLAAYRQFYRRTYSQSMARKKLGHNGSDASGKMAFVFGDQFLRDRRAFRIAFGRPPIHVITIINEVWRNVHKAVEDVFDESVALSDSIE